MHIKLCVVDKTSESTMKRKDSQDKVVFFFSFFIMEIKSGTDGNGNNDLKI